MSVNTGYLCITPTRLEQLHEETAHDPEAPAKYIHPEEDEDVDYEHPEPGLWTERNWRGLHILLTAGQWAEHPLLGQSITGGTPIGGDYCYTDSPVRYFTAEQVKEIAPALADVDKEAFLRSLAPEVLEPLGIPPVYGWPEGDFLALWKTLSKIRDFFQMAQEQGYAVLIYLC